METHFLDGRVTAAVGDITTETTDAIVNAANLTLLGGGGVDGAIRRAGGPAILKECKWLRENIYPDGLPTGEVAITTAGDLPSKYVIHTVGPIYGRNNGRDALLLSACYRNSLLAAISKDLNSITFPAISTGVYDYPKPEAAVVASASITEFINSTNAPLLIRLIFIREEEYRIFIENCRFE